MASRDLRFERVQAPCVRDCPAGIDVPRYIGYVALGKFAEATAVVRERVPFPSVCGYICYRPCEPGCRRVLMEGPVAINALKRAAADRDGKLWRERWADSIAAPTGRRVGIVGSGPAGLTAAYYLAKRRGHQVTVFEAASQAGGQLRIGVPANRLPREVIDEEIGLIAETRVEMRCNTRVEALDDLFAQGYEAVFLSVGTCKPLRLGIPGEDLPGVWEGVRFLQEVNLGARVPVGRRVAIIGGGNVAVDCSRTARRLGAEEVTIVYRRTRQQMPAYDFEVHAAEIEGVRVEFLAAPVRIEPRNGHLALHLTRMELGELDATGRGRPVPIPGSEFVVAVDTVMAAIGQVPDVLDRWGLARNSDGTIKVNPETLQTSRERVFAGGDVVTGPVNIIEAIAHGRKAAEAIDRALGGDGDISEVFAPPPGEEMELLPDLSPRGSPQVHMAELDPKTRTGSFDCCELGLTTEEATREARRCVRCDLWSARGIPPVWWERRGLRPFWQGGRDRMSRERDERRLAEAGT